MEDVDYGDNGTGLIGIIPDGTIEITIVPGGTDYTPIDSTMLGYIADGEYRATTLDLSMNADYSEGTFSVPEGATALTIFGVIFN